MRHSNIAIFIPHQGCPNQCSFCNQNTITGKQEAPTPEQVGMELNLAVQGLKNDPDQTEIAFFGGSFTCIDRSYMTVLLETANHAVIQWGLKGIRISTRPDAIDRKVLALLKEYGVTAIELGAQSLDDTVLQKNKRGHTAEDIRKASHLIRESGFELGLQMMVGLYGDTDESVRKTAEKIVEIHPDTVRIYPTVVLEGTLLDQLLQKGEYQPMGLEQAVNLCADLLLLFHREQIRVIKLGLHASEDVEQKRTGGIYHPAFKELCENRIYQMLALEALKDGVPKGMPVTLLVNDRAISKMVGQRRENLIFLEGQLGRRIIVRGEPDIPIYRVKVEASDPVGNKSREGRSGRNETNGTFAG